MRTDPLRVFLVLLVAGIGLFFRPSYVLAQSCGDASVECGIIPNRCGGDHDLECYTSECQDAGGGCVRAYDVCEGSGQIPESIPCNYQNGSCVLSRRASDICHALGMCVAQLDSCQLCTETDQGCGAHGCPSNTKRICDSCTGGCQCVSDPECQCSPGSTSCGACSVSCGPGTKSCTDGCDTWSEACNNGPCCVPNCNNSGSYCSGTTYRGNCGQTCNGTKPVINGVWSGWSSCSASCGGGIQTRTCTNPPPNSCGADCVGASSQSCNLQACVWWQVVDGDVQTNGDLRSAVPPGYYFDLPGSGGFPGVAKYSGSTSLSSAKVSQKGWLANSAYSSPKGLQNYAFFKKKVPSETTINAVGGTTLVLNGVRSADGNYWYEYDGKQTGRLPLTISSPINLAVGTKVVLLVTDASLNIESNISFTSGQSLFVALVNGNININSSVTNLMGFYLADGTFSTGTSATPFYLKGSVAALGGMNLQRDLGNSLNATTPAEVFEYDPLGIFLFPPKLSVEKIRWKEVAP